MSETLFKPFEQRPAECQAVYVSHDNIDQLARYYAFGGYDAAVVRDQGQPPTLTIRRHDGGDETVVRTEQVLVYGNPPTVMEPDDFHRDWRTAREQQF
jgi:hypothetical protein